MSVRRKRVLHVGCGAAAPGKLHAAFREGWDEVRLDIDPGVQPDIVASLTDMAAVADGSVDAVYSSHNLEHLYPHEVPLALGEMRRVLAAGGFALITLPDVQSVAQLVLEQGLTMPAYQSGMGPVSPIDILYGYRPALAAGNLFMAHHTGFTSASLTEVLLAAGFAAVTVQRVPPALCLWAAAFQSAPEPGALRAMQALVFPLGAPPG